MSGSAQSVCVGLVSKEQTSALMSPSKCTATLVTRNNETTERMIQAFQNILPHGLPARLNRQDQADQNLPTNTDSKHEAQTVQYCHRNPWRADAAAVTLLMFACSAKIIFSSRTTFWLLLTLKYVFSHFFSFWCFSRRKSRVSFLPLRENDKTRVGV